MFPPPGTNDRDALRQVLHSSLQDVLTDVSLDAQQMARSSGVGGNRPGLPSTAVGLQQGSLMPTPSLAAASPFLASANPTASTAALAASALSSLNDSAMFAPGAVGGQEELLLDHARAAMVKQRMIALEQKRQLLIEENKRRLLEDSYMALLRNGMPAAVGPDFKQKAGLPALHQGSNIPLALLASQISTSPAAMGMSAPNTVPPVMNPPSLHHRAANLPQLPDKSAQKANTTKALEALGSSLRKKNDPYIDVSTIAPTAEDDNTVRRTRGGVAEPFPERLHRMLETVEKQGKTEIVSFFSHGRAFGVHDPDRFVEEILPNYFKQSKWNSFARQLNLYGFIRITSGPDAGGYYHELFLRGRPHLCLHMRRVGVPLEGADRRKIKQKGVAGTNANGTDPDFYAMKPLPSAPAATSSGQAPLVASAAKPEEKP